MIRTEQTVVHGDLTLATEAFGAPSHPAILLIMGATASMLGWPDRLCERLAEAGRHVIRFDHRDTGRSTTVPPGEGTYAVEDLAADATAILRAYGINEVHLVGMSLGGYIAQMMALQDPARIASLTLIGSEPLGWDGAPLPHISPVFMDHFASMGSVDWDDRTAAATFLLGSSRLCAAGGPFDEAKERKLIDRVLSRTDSLLSMFNHGTVDTRDDWTGRFRDITCPVLVIHGELDPILPPDNGRAIANGIRGAKLEVLPGIGHALPAGVVDRVADLIAQHTGAA